jgi:hypothetical protein
MALYDFRALGILNQTFILDNYSLHLSLCEMIEDCGANSFAFLKMGTNCYRLSEDDNLYANNVQRRGDILSLQHNSDQICSATGSKYSIVFNLKCSTDQ